MFPESGNFHVVFTLPAEVGALMGSSETNFRAVGDIFFAASSETLSTFMGNNLGCRGGWLSVMHTWGNAMSWHPHLHVIVGGAGRKLESGDLFDLNPKYLFPVKALSKVFAAIFLRHLRESVHVDWTGELENPGAQANWLREQGALEWVTYCEPTRGKTRALVRYLARYAYRTAMSDSRIQAYDPDAGTVRFHCKPKGGSAAKRPASSRVNGGSVTLRTREFARRFARHIAPSRFVRIRRYGLLVSGGLRSVGKRLPPVTATHRNCPGCGANQWTFKRLPAKLITEPEKTRKVPQECGPAP